MKKELTAIIERLTEIVDGDPWFGRSVNSILNEVNPKNVFIAPGNSEHSLIELLYHMNMWADFTLKRIEKDTNYDRKKEEEMDWRTIDPSIHSWEKGKKEFQSIHKKIVRVLKTKEDSFLDDIVDYRTHDFRRLLNGLADHHIYHLGQIAFVNKLLGNTR